MYIYIHNYTVCICIYIYMLLLEVFISYNMSDTFANGKKKRGHVGCLLAVLIHPRIHGFRKMWTPKSWMAYDGKSQSKMDDLGVPPWLRKCPFQEGKPSFKAGISWNFEGNSWTVEGFDGICWSPIPLPTPQSVVLVIKIHDRKREKVLSDKGTASLPYDLRSTFEVAAKKWNNQLL